MIQRQLKSVQKDFLAVIGLSWGLNLKRSGMELTMANLMDLGTERRRKCCTISKIPVIRYSMYQSRGERTIKKQRRRKDNNSLQRKFGKHWGAPPDGRLHQSAQSLRSSGGYDCRAPEKPVASGQLDKQEIITQPPLAEIQANEERQGNLLLEYKERFERLSVDQKLSRLCSEAGLRSVEVGQFFYSLPSSRGDGNQS